MKRTGEPVLGKLTIANDNSVFDIPDGARIMDFIRDSPSAIFGCCGGRCGTCLCTVVKGHENLQDKAHDEWEFFYKRNAPSGQRLACQLRMKKGDATIEF